MHFNLKACHVSPIIASIMGKEGLTKSSSATEKEACPKTATAAAQKKACPKTITTEVSGTEIVADVDIGWGNKLFIRGEGCGLSWEKGVPMQNIENHLWYWKCPGKCPENFQYKLLINDHIWALGENLTANRGTKNFTEPSF